MTIFLPLVSAFLYTTGILLVKRATDLGVGTRRTAFVGNLLAAVVFQALLFLGGSGQPWSRLWQPAIVAALYVAGQGFTFLSLSGGALSVATPVLGVKNVLVPLFTATVLGAAVGGKLWAAAALSTLGIAILNRSPGASPAPRAGRSVAAAVLAAASYALFDILVQKWSPAWGLGRFLPITVGMAGLLSFAFLPRSGGPAPRSAWPWLLGGSFLMSVQSVLFVSCIAAFGQATAANVVYSSRGVWTVLAVWAMGRWFHNREREAGPAALRGRLAGAAVITAAVILAVV